MKDNILQGLVDMADIGKAAPESVVPVSKVFSFFAGSGLLDLAFEKNGFQVDFVNEYFEPFLDAYRYSRERLRIKRPQHGHSSASIDDYHGSLFGELRSMVDSSRSDGALVGFIGGPPCPDFSIGGKNRGQRGDNGRLSQTYVDLIDRIEPDWFLFENVKGLWRTRKHREFYDSLKEQLSKKYKLTDRLFNSIEVGAPQDRDRILLFGIHNRVQGATSIEWEKGLRFPGRSAFSHDWVDVEPFSCDLERSKPNNVPIELTVQHWFDCNDVESHPNQKDCFTPRNGLAKFLKIAEGDVSRKSSKRLHRWRYSPTAAYGNNEVHLHPYKARRITVAEALALQSMPKEFELPQRMTLSNKFKTVGNGVPYLLGQHIALAIAAALKKDGSQN